MTRKTSKMELLAVTAGNEGAENVTVPVVPTAGDVIV